MVVQEGFDPIAMPPSAMDDYLFDLKGFLVIRNALSAAEVREVCRCPRESRFCDVHVANEWSVPLRLLQVAEMNATIDSHLDLQPGMASAPMASVTVTLCTLADHAYHLLTIQASGEAG